MTEPRGERAGQSEPQRGSAPPPTAGETRAGRNVGVGCFTAFMGFWSGGMFGVLLSKIVAGVTRAKECAGIPSCDWATYFFAGALIGALTLPTIVLLRLRGRDAEATTDHSPRG